MSPSSPSPSAETGERVDLPGVSRADVGGCQEFGTGGNADASLLMKPELLLGCSGWGEVTSMRCDGDVGSEDCDTLR